MAEKKASRRISLDQLDDILARAKAERWTHLALIPPDIDDWYRRTLIAKGWPPERVLTLDQKLRTVPDGLTVLADLTSLALPDNEIGSNGAKALAALTNLTSLDLPLNKIGADGAKALTGLTTLRSLNLSGNTLGEDGAAALAALTNLTSLELRSNTIGADGVRALADLTSLTSLDLAWNHVGPEGARALGAMPTLTSLDLDGNKIGPEGARALRALTRLTSLGLAFNKIGIEGARVLSALANLTSLSIARDEIGPEGARALSTLGNLTSLVLWETNIGPEGAKAISALTKLTSLNLTGNGIGDEGARAIAGLTRLESLKLEDNEIGEEGARALLDALSTLPTAERLKHLNLKENRDLSALVPAEVLESGDGQAILAAYRRYRDAEQAEALRPLNEAKMLLLGNEAVGKTSLKRFLIHNQPRKTGEPKTEKIETEPWRPDGCDVTLNVWDFGGQEIMHGTHRFFLTERSLYLVVLEARREDDRSVYDWLKTVRNRGKDSPVIVVINKDESEHGLRLDEPRLRRDYPNIVAFVRTSCEDNDDARASIERLRNVIVETLANDSRLKHVRDPIPDAWRRVKTAVAARAKQQRVLALSAFEQLCTTCDEGEQDKDALITGGDEQRALLGLLNDLGVVVARGLARDARAAQREVTLLDPNWLTGAIYTLLNHPRIKDQRGEFKRRQLSELLDANEYPLGRHEFIIDMMEHEDVGLCFEVPGTHHEEFLIPEALPPSEPDYGMWPKDSLHFRYEYAFLPRGVMPRFIVQAHRNLTEKPTTWRAGVVLGAAKCKVLVRADLDKKKVHIAVSGPVAMRRSALNVVLDDLDEVHARNPETAPEAMVPLPDNPDVAVSYEHLLKLEQTYAREYSFLPVGAEREYTVPELLEGVRREPRYRGEYGDLRRSGPREEPSRVEPPPVVRSNDTPAQRAEHKEPAGAIRQVLILLAAVVVLAGALTGVWSMAGSTGAFLAIAAVVLLVLVPVMAFVAANAQILTGTQLQEILLAVLKKIPGLSAWLGNQKTKPPQSGDA